MNLTTRSSILLWFLALREVKFAIAANVSAEQLWAAVAAAAAAAARARAKTHEKQG